MTLRPQYHVRRAGDDILIWNVTRLVALAAHQPVVDWPLSVIREMDEPYWFDATGEPATTRAVAKHARQIAHVDLSYPILICPEGRIIDGMHRVARAWLDGHTTIKARRLDHLPAPDAKNVSLDDLPYDF